MAKVYIYARTQKVSKDAEVPIWVRASLGRSADYRTPTGHQICQKYWDAKAGRPKSYMGGNVERAKNLKALDDKLTSLREALARGIAQNEEFTKSLFESIVRDCYNEGRILKAGKPHDILEYCRKAIDEMKDGTRRITNTKNAGERYNAHTIAAWGTFLNVLEEFTEERCLTWDNVTETDLYAFKDHILRHGYLATMQNKLITTFRALANMAAVDNVFTNTKVFSALTKVDQTAKESKPIKVYLTEAEIEALYNMPIPIGDLKDQVRDLFCMGCYTGQRVSDYNHLAPEMFQKSAHGSTVIKLRQKKTGNDVVIPVLSDHVLELARKYNYKMPTVAEQIINRYIKEICKALSQSVPSLAEKIVTAETMRDKKKDEEASEDQKCERDSKGRAIRPKWSMVSTHTARRSCITNLYLSSSKTGITEREIMKISGHKDVRSFEQYLCMSDETIAESIAQKMNEYNNPNSK